MSESIAVGVIIYIPLVFISLMIFIESGDSQGDSCVKSIVWPVFLIIKLGKLMIEAVLR